MSWDIVTGDAFWRWIERISWLAALMGLLIAAWIAFRQLPLLRYDQRKLAEELTNKPNVEMGFERVTNQMLVLDQSTVIAPSWSSATAEVDITIMAFNAGGRTARNLLWNFVFPPSIEPLQIKIGTDRYAWLGPPPYEKSVDPNGDHRLRFSQPNYLHPNVRWPATIKLGVPRGAHEFEIVATVSMDDAKPAEKRFRVIVKEATLPQGSGDI